MNKLQYSGSCEVHGHILTQNISVNASKNPLRVSEAVQESSARINVIVPGHPDRLPEAERITPIIYVWGGQAESRWSSGGGGNLATSIKLVGKEYQHCRGGSNPSLTPKYLPLRKNVPLGQGIVLFKFNEKSGFSCNSTGGLQRFNNLSSIDSSTNEELTWFWCKDCDEEYKLHEEAEFCPICGGNNMAQCGCY